MVASQHTIAQPTALFAYVLLAITHGYMVVMKRLRSTTMVASNPAVPTFFAYSKNAVPLFLPASEKKAGTAGYEATTIVQIYKIHVVVSSVSPQEVLALQHLDVTEYL